MNTRHRTRVRRIDRILRLMCTALFLGFLARWWVPGAWRYHWWEFPGTAPYHGTQPGFGGSEG